MHDEIRSCKFGRGTLVHHRNYNYRGVVYDVDSSCTADESWYSTNRTQPDRDQPWYHVLVDGAAHTTYVAEQNLEPDTVGGPIRHPLVDELFSDFREGRYVRDLDA